MNERKEYLSEEQYQRANKKVKTAGVIMMLIGITAIVVGIVMLVVGKESVRMFGGMPIVLGLGVTTWGCMVRFFIGNQREISAYMAQQQMPVAKEGIEKMAPTVGGAAKEIAKGIKEGINEADNKNTEETSEEEK